MPRDFFLHIRQRGICPLRLLALALLAFLPACKYDSADVEWTFPASGDSEVGVQPAIAIRLTNTMSPSDVENTLPENIKVTGDQTSGEYSGVIVAANEEDVFGGQTISQFQQGITSPDELPDLEDLAEMTEEAGDNTLVFLLGPGQQFKPGERITVTVSEDVTVLGVPFARPYVFSFTVEGGEARSEGELFVRETLPVQASGAAGLRPAVTAYLSANISSGSESDAVRVVGSQSGNHAGGISRLDQNDVLTSVVHVLGVSDSFIPGEEVSVAFTSSITSAASADSRLSPYQVTFQVRPGHNQGGWEASSLQPLAPDGAVAVLAADFLPASGAVELVTVSSTLATLYDSMGRRGTAEVTPGWTFMDAVGVDADGNGSVQIVALLLGSQGELRLQEYRVDESGSISASDSRLDFATLSEAGAADSPGRLQLADLDSDGLPELVALHGDGSFDEGGLSGLPEGLGDIGDLGDLGDLGLPGEEEEPQSTGYLTIFQLTMGLPAGGFDFNDPENLLELQFMPLRNPISGFEQSRKLQLADLDNDGRLDLVCEASAGGLVLYRNQTTSANPFSFRKVGTLKGSEGADYAPDAWVVFDFDTDGDVDVISWKDDVPVVHENSYRDVDVDEVLEGGLEGGNDLLASLAGTEPRGLLFEDVVPEELDLDGAIARRDDILVASNLDGDALGTADLVIAGAGDEGRGSLVFLRNSNQFLLGQGFERLELDNGEAGTVSGFALLDLDGDTGLDIATVSDDSPLVYGSLGVEAISVPDPTGYRLQPVDENGADVNVDDLSELEANDVFGVKVIADIRSSFSGYSVALDYERFELDYLGFTPPEGFEQLAVFEACPQGENDLSCSGFATASMTYQQDTTGAPFENVELGVFRFRCRQVFGRTDTVIDFAAPAATVVSNVLTAVEAGVSQEVPVETGEAIEFELEPPPPPELEVTCNVEERGALSSEVLISWQSQVLRYDRVKIEIADGPPTYLDWDRGSHVMDVSSPGDVSIAVTALLGAADIGPTVICGVIHVPQPTDVRCEQEFSKDSVANTVTWAWDPAVAVDQFRIYRNGFFRASVLPVGGFLYEDFFQSLDDGGGSDLYEVSAVLGGIESSRGACSGIDPEPCNTEAPIRSPIVGTLLSRSSPSAPLRIRWDWSNGEAYDGMTLDLLFEPAEPGSPVVRLFGEDGMTLQGQEANRGFLLHEGALDRGGAAPGVYTLTLTAVKNAESACDGFAAGTPIDSDLVSFQPFTLDAPGLDEVGLNCLKDSDGIAVNWDEPWRGYGDNVMVLELTHTIEGEEAGSRTIFDILPSDSGYFFDSIEPVGSYEVTLRAGEEQTSCAGIVFSPAVAIGETIAARGEPSFEIPLTATGLAGDVEAVEFDLVIPEGISLLEPALAAVSLGDGMKRVEVREGDLSVESAGGVGGLEAVLARLVAELPAELPERDEIRLENARIRFAGFESWRSIEASEGSIQYANSYLKLDVVPDAEDPAVFHVAVRGSLRAPAEIPGYSFNAYNIHLQFNPEQFELLPVDQEQEGTIAAGLGELFLPVESTLPDTNSTGDLRVGWISFNFSTLQSDLIEPFEDATVLELSFRSKLDDTAGRTFSQISFLSDPGAEQPTAFFPEQAVPGRPVIDAFFDASISLGGDLPVLELLSLSPVTGPLTGGNEVRLSGDGFDGGGLVPAIRLLPVEGDTDILEVSVAGITVLNKGSISFVVPDSLGARPVTLPAESSVLYDIELSIGDQAVLLPEAYSFETPSLGGVDVSSLRATCGDFIEVSGTGFSRSTVVKLQVDGFEPLVAAPFGRSGRPAISNDGRTMLVRAPTEGLPVLDEAFVVVEVLDPLELAGAPIESLSLPTPLDIIEGDCDAAVVPNMIVVNLIQPGSVSICGGNHVDLFGNGFTERCEVLVDGAMVDRSGFVFHSGQHLSFFAPSRVSAGQATLQVRDPLTLAQSEVFLNYQDPPMFVRGDVDGDRQVTDSDVTLLSSLLFGGAGLWPDNRDAADTNDDGQLNFGDLMRLLSHLQNPDDPGEMLAAPFPVPGSDPTEDSICE